jgi:hypothetical protein
MPSTPRDEAAKMTSPDMMSADERTLYEPSDDEGYNPSEVSDGDHDILESEDERERLLTQKEGFSGLFNKKGVRIGKRASRDAPRRVQKEKERERGTDGETSALMYEMEEGVGVSRGSLENRSSDEDARRMLATTSHWKVCCAISWHEHG